MTRVARIQRTGRFASRIFRGESFLRYALGCSRRAFSTTVNASEMDGLEATRAIRAREQIEGGHMPIVAMTAHAMKGDRQRCLDAGMDGYVAKPIHAQEVLGTIEAVLASCARRAEQDESRAVDPAN